jgi:pSer/pThr/pTyr-binding forkhead associated (FHA) protein
MARPLVLEALPDQGSEPLRIVIAPDQDISLGRTERAQVIVSHSSVMSLHARVWFEGGAWQIQDMKSNAGTFVNERPIGFNGTATIRPGDVVRLAAFALRVGEGRLGDVPTVLDTPRRS